jgi:four helix bundle protein
MSTEQGTRSDGEPLVTLAERTKEFAIRIIRLHSALPRGPVVRVIGNQFLRSGTSVGAHCREAFRGRSDAEWISKMEVALQELDETLYWLELLIAAEVLPAARLTSLMHEINELIAIIVASLKTVKERRKR